QLRPAEEAASNAARSTGCGMLASANPQTSDAAARYADSSTMALASVGTARRCSKTRSFQLLVQCEAGQAARAISTAHVESMTAAPTELALRSRARPARVRFLPHIRSVK